jgi:hypothetical protein
LKQDPKAVQTNLGSAAGRLYHWLRATALLLPHSMSSSKSKQPHNIPLEGWHRKQLLCHIEEAGGLDKANFKAICDSNPTIFGGSGKGIRRSFQNEVSNIRKRSPRNYLRLLSSYGI